MVDTRRVLWAPALALGLTFSPPPQPAPVAVPLAWHRTVAMLQFLSEDFDEAVVFSPDHLEEYEVQAEEAVEAAKGGGPDLVAYVPALENLRNRVLARADGEQVVTDADELVASLIQKGRLVRWPTRPVDYSRGKKLYESNCAQCHAADGSAQAKTAESMWPEPMDLIGESMVALSSYQVFNSLSFGVPGTAMPSYEVLSESDRWALSAYVFTLRQPPCTVKAPTISVPEWFTAIEGELSLRYGDAALACLRAQPPQP